MRLIDGGPTVAVRGDVLLQEARRGHILCLMAQR
jgi:hypothetical protein